VERGHGGHLALHRRGEERSLEQQPLLAGTVPSIDAKMDAVNYIDLAASWYITKTWSITAASTTCSTRIRRS